MHVPRLNCQLQHPKNDPWATSLKMLLSSPLSSLLFHITLGPHLLRPHSEKFLHLRGFAIRATGFTIARGSVARPRVEDRKIPVVLIEDVKDLGKAGEIIRVRRGLARNELYPKELAVAGTWENIDMFAKPSSSDDEAKGRNKTSSSKHEDKPDIKAGRIFGWVGETVELSYIIKTMDEDETILLTPIDKWKVLQSLTDEYCLDLLPHCVEFIPPTVETIEKVGVYRLKISIPVIGSIEEYFIELNVMGEAQKMRQIQEKIQEDEANKQRKNFSLASKDELPPLS